MLKHLIIWVGYQPTQDMYRIKPQSRKRTISTKQDLTEIAEQYRNINYQTLADRNDETEPIYRKNKETQDYIYCEYCVKVGDYDLGDLPKLEIIVVTFTGKRIKAYCRCINCGIIVCYKCQKMVVLERQKYLKTICQTCKFREIQVSKPTKKCECSDECDVMIPITNLKGQLQKYANGHGLVSYHSTKNLKWIDNLKEVEEYRDEREQYNS